VLVTMQFMIQVEACGSLEVVLFQGEWHTACCGWVLMISVALVLEFCKNEFYSSFLELMLEMIKSHWH